MCSIDLNLDWVEEEEEEEEGPKLSAGALGSTEGEELDDFVDYLLHGSDSDVSQSKQSTEELSSRTRVVNNGNEGMNLDFLELGLGLGLNSDNGNIGTYLVESGESSSSSSSSMREMELVCEEDVRVVENESNTNNELPFDLNLSDQEVFEPLSEDVRVVENELNTNNELPFDLNLSDQEVFGPLSEDVRDVENESNLDYYYYYYYYYYNASLNQGDAIMVDTSDDFSWLYNYYSEYYDDDFMLYFGNLSYALHDEDGDLMDLFVSALYDLPDGYSYSSMPNVTCDVDNLTSVILTQEELNKSNSICAICMENFCTEEKLKRLPCFHYYHEDCISPWLRTRNTCPVCRYELPII